MAALLDYYPRINYDPTVTEAFIRWREGQQSVVRHLVDLLKEKGA